MADDKKKKILLQLETDMTEILGKYQFIRCGNRMWLRKLGWKSDHVYLVAKSPCILTNLCVWIPPAIESKLDYEYIGFINLGTYIGRGAAGHYYPKWFISLDKFRRNLISDLDKGMKWFDSFTTPQKCLEYIKEHKTDLSSPSAIYCQKYLAALPPEAITGDRIPLSHDYPNEYSRALFDLEYTGQLPKIEGEDDVESDE